MPPGADVTRQCPKSCRQQLYQLRAVLGSADVPEGVRRSVLKHDEAMHWQLSSQPIKWCCKFTTRRRCPFALCRHDCVLLRQLVTRGAEKDFVYARTGECNDRAKLASE